VEPPEKIRRPIQTNHRWGRLASIFYAGDELNILIARLCVLFEDLRIEISGLSADDLGRLDECGKNGRGLYFLRRSIATLHEFTSALDDLDQLPSFQPVRARFNGVAQRHWDRALKYFRKHERYVARMRHNVGGHFGKQATESAVRNLYPASVGSLEIFSYGSTGGAKLLFATEIAATATLGNVKGDSSQARSRKMVRRAVVGYRHAVWAVDCIVKFYLWDRFGR
jgi:hypothetical protein